MLILSTIVVLCVVSVAAVYIADVFVPSNAVDVAVLIYVLCPCFF